jgi:hypothetical protein
VISILHSPASSGLKVALLVPSIVLRGQLRGLPVGLYAVTKMSSRLGAPALTRFKTGSNTRNLPTCGIDENLNEGSQRARRHPRRRDFHQLGQHPEIMSADDFLSFVLDDDLVHANLLRHEDASALLEVLHRVVLVVWAANLHRDVRVGERRVQKVDLEVRLEAIC